MGSLDHLDTHQRSLAKEVHWLASLGVQLVDSTKGGVIVQKWAESSLVVEVKEKQYDDPLLVQLNEGIHKQKTMAFSFGTSDGRLRYQGQLCVPYMDGLQERIMTEAHSSKYSVHPCSTKMYHDHKRDVKEFVARCSKCQQGKAEHQKPAMMPPFRWFHSKLDMVEDVDLALVVGDPSLIVPVEAIEVNEELTFEEILVAILDRQVWKLRNKEITSVKCYGEPKY
nr:uncharacterized protein LOC117273904 [Nicotiana tomentosiformis]